MSTDDKWKLNPLTKTSEPEGERNEWKPNRAQRRWSKRYMRRRGKGYTR